MKNGDKAAKHMTKREAYVMAILQGMSAEAGHDVTPIQAVDIAIALADMALDRMDPLNG